MTHRAHESPFQRQFRMRIDMEDATYTGLRKLKVKGKDLDDLPESIFQLRELEVLDLSPEREACIDFHLVLLPPSISLLLHLRVLMLDTNSLSHLPPSISALSRLQQLSLSNNFVSQLPQEMDQLQELSSIHLSNNHFQVFPEVLCSLPNLGHVDISCNKISILPASITSLRKLHTLIACHNSIQALPESIGQLLQLNLLWIGYNRIKSLPRSIVDLERLDWGKVFMTSSVLRGNPLSRPPMEVCEGGVAAMKKYFQGQQRGRS